MDTGLSIAASGLAAATTEIDVTSENIANAQTSGYVQQTAVLDALASPGTDGVGEGVEVSSIAQVQDALLSANNYQAQGALSNLGSLQQVLTGIQDIFPLGQSASSSDSSTETSSSNSSIAGQLADFWSSWDGIAEDPTSATPRTQVVDLAQGLVTTLNEASTQLTQLSADTSTQLSQQVAQTNTLLGEAAQLNGQIVTASGGGSSPNQLEDQLNGILGQLAQTAGINVQTNSDGTASVSIGGVNLVQGDQATTIAVSSSGGSVTLTAGSGAIPLTVSGGTIGGLLTGLNQSIPEYEGMLNSVASSLATTVNTQLAAGQTASGAPGSDDPLFTVNGGTTTPTADEVTAASITLNSNVVDDPSLLAAASGTDTTAEAANDGSNAQAMAELASSTSGPDSDYQQLVESIGSDTSNVNTQVAAQTSVADQAQQALSSATGVDTDNQLVNLMQFQSAYQASAKLVSVIDTAIQSLLSAV